MNRIVETIKDIAIAKSELSHTRISDDFESEDFFLQILNKKTVDLPEDHYIRPFLLETDKNLGEIHFLPEGRATSHTENRSEILLIGVQSIREYVGALRNGQLVRHDRIYGRSDSEMAGVAEAIGFTIHSPKEDGSKIMSATPGEIAEGYAKLENRLTPELLERLTARKEREPIKLGARE